MTNPSEHLVRLYAKQVYSGKMITSVVLEQFTELLKKSFASVISDIIQERFKTALNKEKEAEKGESSGDGLDKNPKKDDGIETTLDEMEAFYIVKAILSQKVALNRIYHRDTKSYFGILLDDNNRKPICRFYISDKKKQLVTFGEGKTEQKHDLENLDDIYKYAPELLAAVDMYN